MKEHLKAYLDGELSPFLHWCVRQALQKNPELQKELEKMEKMTQTIQTEAESETPLPDTLRDKLRATAPPISPIPSRQPPPLRNLVMATGITVATLGLAYVVNLGEMSGGDRTGVSSSIPSITSNPLPASSATLMYTQDYEGYEGDAISGSTDLGRIDSLAVAPSIENSKFQRRGRIASKARNQLSEGFGTSSMYPRYASGNGAAWEANANQVHREASLEVLVPDVLVQSERAEKEIIVRGGRVERGDVTTNKTEKVAAFTLRVPVEKFDETLKLFAQYGEVIGKHISSEDLTNQIKANKKQVESQSKNVKTTNEQLKDVERTARDARERIAIMTSLREQLAGQQAELDRLSDQAKFATLYLSFKEKRGVVAARPTGIGPELLGAVEAMGKSLRLLLRLPFQFLLYAIAYAPLWIPLAFLWRRALRELK
jgi:Domain of unknown function (DUF4349)